MSGTVDPSITTETPHGLGVLVPLGLERAGADPAVASSVFVTMVTDSMGFLVFLGLATAAGL